MYFETITQMSKILRQLDQWLVAAEAYAAERSFQSSVLMHARLAPDQWPLPRQVQTSCTCAVFAAAWLSGQDPPPEPADAESTVGELIARIRSDVAYLDQFTPADFAGAPTLIREFWYERVMSASDFVREDAMPTFYFHVTHAYAILRHNGLKLTKLDFLGPVTVQTT